MDETRLVGDADAAMMARKVEAGTRGPVLLKWIRMLFEDRRSAYARCGKWVSSRVAEVGATVASL
jgi:hypothetical protein